MPIFSGSIKHNELQTGSKFIMHIKGLKCDVKVDSTVNTVAVAGVGRVTWKSECFSRVAQTLFRRYVQEAESQIHDSQTEDVQVHDSQTDEVKVVQRPLEITGILSSGVLRCTSTPTVPHLAQRVMKYPVSKNNRLQRFSKRFKTGNLLYGT